MRRWRRALRRDRGRAALWHEGMVDLLARNIDGAGPLRTISPIVRPAAKPGTLPITIALQLLGRQKRGTRFGYVYEGDSA